MGIEGKYSQAFGYRADGLLNEVHTSPPGEAMSVAKLAYDKDGLLTARSLDGVTLSTFNRDPQSGQVTSTTDTTNAAGARTETLTYDHGRLDTRAITKPGGGSETVDYDYNDAGELKQAKTTSGSSVSTDQYAYLDTGSVDWVKRDGALTDYSYDDARQLTSIEDPGGSTRDLEYDELGRRISTEQADGTVVDVSYDLFGYQSGAHITGPGGVDHTEVLDHDATGTLTAVNQSGLPFGEGSSPTTLDFDLVWDRMAAVPQVMAAVNPMMTSSLFWAGSWNFALSAPDATGPLGYDALGDPVANGGAGDNSLRTLDMGAYGEWSERTIPLMGRGFEGEVMLPDGQVHLRARNYDANTQSFTTRDPLAGVVGSNNLTNPYHYADNDPVNRHDPMGLRGEQKDPCGKSWFDEKVSTALSWADDDLCFNSGTGAEAAKDFLVEQAPALIVSTVVTSGCLVVTGGAGSLGCVALGGAAGGAVRGALECRREHTSCVEAMGRAAATDAVLAVGFEVLGMAAGSLRSGASSLARSEARALGGELAAETVDDAARAGVSTLVKESVESSADDLLRGGWR